MIGTLFAIVLPLTQKPAFPTYDLKSGQQIRYSVGIKINDDPKVLQGSLLLKVNKPWPSAGWDVDVVLELSEGGKGKVEKLVSNWIVEKTFKPKALGAGSNVFADSFFKCLWLPTSEKMSETVNGQEFKRSVEIRQREDVIEMDSTLDSKIQTGIIAQHFDPKLGIIRRAISQLKTNGNTITFEIVLPKS